MKYLKQIAIIFSVSFAGELLKLILPFPIPASVYGLVILLILLMSKLVRIEQVKAVGSFLIEVMPIMFLPPAINLLAVWSSFKSKALSYLIIMIVTTLVVMVISGVTSEKIINAERRNK